MCCYNTNVDDSLFHISDEIDHYYNNIVNPSFESEYYDVDCEGEF